MKFSLTFFTLMVLLTACHQRRPEPETIGNDNELHRRIVGNWHHARDVSVTNTFLENGEWRQAWADHTNGVVKTEGTFEIKDGVLISVMTKHSNTNARVPFLSRDRITRLNEQELVLEYESSSGGVTAKETTQVYRRTGK